MNPAIESFSVRSAANGFIVTVYLNDRGQEPMQYVVTTQAKLKKLINNLLKKEEA